MAVGTAFTTRHDSPLSFDTFQIDRCTPVPCGPDTSTSPLGDTLMSGSPYAWIGSTMRGTPHVICGFAAPAPELGARAGASAVMANSPTAHRPSFIPDRP